ncbi:MAG: hypothetical protein ABIE22_01540 [archaeon]
MKSKQILSIFIIGLVLASVVTVMALDKSTSSGDYRKSEIYGLEKKRVANEIT